MEDKKGIEDFLITEYNNVAQAHFNTIMAISNFFKHYLLIVSLPISTLLLILNIKNDYLESALIIIPSYIILCFRLA